jgi:hypothetical protein
MTTLPVSSSTIQRIFNANDYWGRAKSGEFTQKILKDGHPSPPLADEPFCTKSQIVEYVDRSGNTVAHVHQYVRTDGTLGASGRPDPKALCHNGVLYYVCSPGKRPGNAPRIRQPGQRRN